MLLYRTYKTDHGHLCSITRKAFNRWTTAWKESPVIAVAGGEACSLLKLYRQPAGVLSPLCRHHDTEGVAHMGCELWSKKEAAISVIHCSICATAEDDDVLEFRLLENVHN